MLPYIFRRLWQAALTIFGIMVITFLLFRVISGDIASAQLGEKATERQKADWRYIHGYYDPLLVNVHGTLQVFDNTEASRPLSVRDAKGSAAAEALSLILTTADNPTLNKSTSVLMGRYVPLLSPDTPLEELTDNTPLVEKLRQAPPAQPATQAAATQPATQPAAATEPASQPASQPARPQGENRPVLNFVLGDGSKLDIDFTGVKTAGDVIDRINNDPANGGRLTARLSKWEPADFFQSQFFHHLWNSITFQSRSLKDNQLLVNIIAERGPYSLALTVPAMALEWYIAMIISCLVAYYRGSLGDKIGVFLSVLGMCVPFLAFMMAGQYLVFLISPPHAYGLQHISNLYVPIGIMVLAGIGGNVRFYRTVILDETNRDYVRTARAKGVPLASIMFKHILKNCMLPILTSLVMTIPFLIMGSLLVESYFGIPGLGDLLLTSINDRNEPVMNGLVFLMAMVTTLSILLTDICYAIFDPRIRLK